MSWAVLSPALIVVAALLLLGLERLFPYEPRQRLLRTGFFTDLVAYGLVQSYCLGFVISGLIGLVDRHTGLSGLGLLSDWPVLAQLAFFFVTHDLYIYWFHRLQHHSDLLWRTHEAHHSHALEIVINQTVEFLPIVLLGAAPEVAFMKATLDAVWGMYIHANIDVRAGLLQRVLNGPEMHRWHHARELAAPGKNFATKLALWDWIFGTAYLPSHKPAAYGLPDQGYPKRGFGAYFLQHAHSLRLAKETRDG
jgi:sterol desaturase/sphingolipid hydroxylase (fatty acid hydroxylase superfamily)